jgi:hypothetical protein
MAAVPTGKTVCLITPGHIASNPRLVKEAMALTESGYKVHLIFTQYVNYLVNHDQQILDKNPGWTYDYLNWTGHSLASKFHRILSKLSQSVIGNNNIKLNRNYSWQLQKAKNFKADLYIAHNLGALPIAVIAAEKNEAKSGFDAEDFHRNEVSDDPSAQDVKLKTAIEEKYIPLTDYITAASPQIAEHYTRLFKRDIVTVLNVFPKVNPQPITSNIDKPLQLFWFSQTIGPDRGLETIIEAINLSNLKMDFHLLGKVTDEYRSSLISLIKDKAQLHFHKPVAPDDIFKLAFNYDIGFSSEQSIPLSRNICLTNKLFTYIQCGLVVLLSDTTAQASFLQQHQDACKLYNNASDLAGVLIEYHNNRPLLYAIKQDNFNLGQTTLNWGTEHRKFMQNVNKVTGN